MAYRLVPISPSDTKALIVSNPVPSKTLTPCHSLHRPPEALILASASTSFRSQHSPSPRIFIKGLSLSTNEGFLRKIFSQFGEVKDVKVARNKGSQSLGYAFVSYAREEDALLAVDGMNGQFVDGRFILVAIGRPEIPDRERKATRYRF